MQRAKAATGWVTLLCLFFQKRLSGIAGGVSATSDDHDGVNYSPINRVHDCWKQLGVDVGEGRHERPHSAKQFRPCREANAKL